MKISYDYEELIQELKEELEDTILSLTDKIQILRSTIPIDRDYRPIIDWYYIDKITEESLNIDIFDDEETRKEKKELLEEYRKNKPFLEEVLLQDCLDEMEEWNSLF